MDDLEKYIKNNKRQLDDKRAPAGIWDNIVTELDPPTKKSNYKKWLGIGLVVLIGIAAIGFALKSSGQNTNQIDETDAPLLYAELESFKETEQYYQSAIYASYQELSNKHKDETLDDDLKALDKIDLELRREYKNAQGIYREQILRTLIQNHQTKLNLMLDVLDMLNEQHKIEENVF